MREAVTKATLNTITKKAILARYSAVAKNLIFYAFFLFSMSGTMCINIHIYMDIRVKNGLRRRSTKQFVHLGIFWLPSLKNQKHIFKHVYSEQKFFYIRYFRSKS